MCLGGPGNNSARLFVISPILQFLILKSLFEIWNLKFEIGLFILFIPVNKICLKFEACPARPELVEGSLWKGLWFEVPSGPGKAREIAASLSSHSLLLAMTRF